MYTLRWKGKWGSLTGPAASSNVFWTLIWSWGKTGAAITYLTPKQTWWLTAAWHIFFRYTVIWTELTGRRSKEQLKSFFLKQRPHRIFTDPVWIYTVWVLNINALWIKLNILCPHPKLACPRKKLRWNDYTKYVWRGEIPHIDFTQLLIIGAQTRQEIRSKPCWLLLWGLKWWILPQSISSLGKNANKELSGLIGPVGGCHDDVSSRVQTQLPPHAPERPVIYHQSRRLASHQIS